MDDSQTQTEEQQKLAKARAVYVAEREKLMAAYPSAQRLALITAQLRRMEQVKPQLGLAPASVAEDYISRNYGGYATAMERVFAKQCFSDGAAAGALAVMNAVSEVFLNAQQERDSDSPPPMPFNGYHFNDVVALIDKAFQHIAGVETSKQWSACLDEAAAV